MKNTTSGTNNNASTATNGASALSPKKSLHAASYSNLSLASHGSILAEAAGSAGGNGYGAAGSLQACTDYAVGLLSALPASDHALAYVVLETGVRDHVLSGLHISHFDSLSSCHDEIFYLTFVSFFQMIIVALATFDSELYVTFPGTVSPYIDYIYLLVTACFVHNTLPFTMFYISFLFR